MSKATVHLRSPINSSPAFQTTDSVPDSTPHSPFPQFKPDDLNPGAGSFSRARSRPRLAKLRKQSASQHARSRIRTAGGDEAGGFDSVRSDKVSGNVSSALNGLAGGSGGVECAAGACDGGSSDDCRSKFRNEGFVFGAGNVGSDSARVCREGYGSTVEGGEGATERETELRKDDHVEFVFSARRSDRKTSEDAAGMGCGDGRKLGLDSDVKDGGFGIKGFVFRAGQNGFVDYSNAEKGKSSECVENSGLGDGGERNGKAGVECERQDRFHFVFGDNRSGKTSSFNEEKQESLNRMRDTDCGMGAFNTKAETNGNSYTGYVRCAHLVNDDKSKSGYGSADGVSTASSAIPAYNLTEEMKKLNINDPEGADITRDSTKLHVNSSTDFVFGGREKACGYSRAGSGTNVGGHQSCTNAAFENIGGQYFKACETTDVEKGSGCGISFGSAGIPYPKPSTGQEGIRDFPCGQPGDSQVNGATGPFSCSSAGLDSHPNDSAYAGHSLNTNHDKCDNYFTSIPEASKESYMEFKPPTWDPSSFKDNLFPKLNKKLESTQKVRSSKEKGSKYLRRKLKSHSMNKEQTSLDQLSKEDSSLETPASPGCFSPMDYSPYQDATTTDDNDVKASEELNDLHSTIPADSKDEHAAAVGGGVDIRTTDQRYGAPDNDKLFSPNGSFPVGGFHSSGPEIVWPNLKTERFSSSAQSGIDFSSNTEQQKAGLFCFVHGLGDSKEKDSSLSVSSTLTDTSSALKCKQKKKNWRRIGRDSFVISPHLKGKVESSVQFSPLATAKEGDFASSATIHDEACEKWRLRGNQAYKDGDLSKAEDFYTLGIDSVPSSEKSGCWVKPLLLCYSNRAATRMSLGRIREAIGDCMMASDLDPTFLKVQMRTANCQLLLGEIENAQQCFSKCLESGNSVCLDRRVVVEAAEGLQKAKKVAECLNNAAELLKERTSDAAGTALEILTKALSISLYSEKLLQMKAEALFLMQKYDAAIKLCEQSQYLAEKNFAMTNSTNNFKISMSGSSFINLWRWSLISKCYFHLGRLEASLNVLDKLQQVVSVNDKSVIDNIEDLLSLATTIRELLEHKRAGNENFKLGKYTEAVENYTVALSSNIKSRPFAAICFCNRAAAHQALGQISDAIADCSMAMALDGNYAKAISRRATLHEMVRHYEQATLDLRRFISALESQSNQKAKQSDSPNGSHGVKELRQAHQRLLTVEDQSKREIPLDFYLILGVKSADTATDIKKAYHKAALRHHPDKAGQLLARSEVGDEGQVWKEILQEVHKDADRLFKMIGEAYAVLSDLSKRSEYDMEEEIRKAFKQSNRRGTCRRSSDVYGYGRSPDGYKSPTDRSSNRRYERDHWKTYGHSYSRW